jgi:excisionase family DNA binding protein
LSEVTGPNKEFSTSQIAKALEVSTRTIYRWIEGGEIEYSRTVTGRYRFPESELRRILEERKRKGLDKISEVILKTVKRKKIVYLRELQITLEDIFLHEYVYDECLELVNSGDLNTEIFDENRWFFPKNVNWNEVESLANHKIELMNAYINHPRQFVRRGVIYDDYGEMLVEDALIKTGYIVVSKNAHYFNGKEYHQEEDSTPGRKRDLDFIAYERSKDLRIGIQVKNRLEYPRMDDVHLLLDICNTIDLIPVLVTRLSHPRIYSVFEGIRGEVMQTKRYFLQPPFPREKWKQINTELRIPLSIHQWVPDFLLRNFEKLKSKL